MIKMKRNKIYPQEFSRRSKSTPHNFFKHLFTNQRFLAIFSLVIIVLIIIPLARTYSQHRLMEKQLNEVQGQINNYENQNKQLENLVKYLKSDQSLEVQARLNFNMKKAGEGVIVVKNPKINIVNSNINTTTKKFSNLLKWWRYFFN